MAKINQRLWKVPGQRTKRKAWGFTAQINGKQVKHYRAEWTREEAEAELAKKLLQIEPEKPKGAGFTFARAIERYLAAKARKLSIGFDKMYLNQLKAAFGAETPLANITAARISAWKAEKLAATCMRTGRPYAAASINRPLAALRHLLQLAHDEWGELSAVPKIRLEKEPEGRVRYLSDNEQVKLLRACEDSINPELRTIVLVLLHTGGRRGEVLSLTWEHGVDFAQGVVKFHGTKNGKSRSVPMTEAVYAALSALPQRGTGRVFHTRSIRTAFERAAERAGLVDFHIHDCRHTFASQLVMRGATLQAVKELLGHHSLQMVLRYAHLSPAHLREAVAKLDASAVSAQGSAQEVVELESLPRN